MRWRDVKHGKITQKNITPTILDFTISPISNRIKAFITDTFMLLMPLMYMTFYLIMGSREVFAERMLEGWAFIFIPHFFIIMAFYLIKSQTPGYKAYDMKLVDKNLKKPTILQFTIRYFTFFLSTIFIAGLVLAITRKDKKTLHDLISGTMPIQIEK
ncbi:RDD family protein [Sulfurospirillum arcachonense]|uniref:RDD family protein n=1 Tax=Sulfurospirillum arcachonense TaxID=57666 RepID=UPI000468F6FA|nr:RDD family protein [Sulfurospirillum arcachonense]